MQSQLTPRQTEVYEAIRKYAAKGRSPSLRELSIKVGMSTWPLRRHLNILTQKGLLRPRRPKTARDIHLAENIPEAA
jgi:SOS-response transcriptional repressor LexA